MNPKTLVVTPPRFELRKETVKSMPVKTGVKAALGCCKRSVKTRGGDDGP